MGKVTKKQLDLIDKTSSVELVLTEDNPDDDLRAYDLLDFVEQHWFTHGRMITMEEARDYDLDMDLFKKWLCSKKWREKLAARGVPLPDVRQKGLRYSEKLLTPKQWGMLKAYTDLNDTRSITKKLQDNEVSTDEWAGWMLDPNFVKVLHSYTETQFANSKHEALLSLLDAVKTGDVNATKFYLEMTGRYRPKGESGNLNVQDVVTQIVEILQEELKDAETLSRIGTRMMGIFAGIADEADPDDVDANRTPTYGGL